MARKRFYICRSCNTIIDLVEGEENNFVCGENKMEALIPGAVDAAAEKHVPEVSVEGDTVSVAVGSVIHPATEAHHITWICLETKQGRQFKYLEHTAEPKVSFKLIDDTPRRVYAYCNLHGLWVKEL